MKELDFDELDRAVSSLMSDTAGSVPDSSESPKEKTLDIPSSATNTPPTTSFDTLQPDVVKKAVEQPSDDNASANAAPAIRRSSGRFMDVVHPSSDMKQPTPQKPTTRQGINISPAPSPLVVPSKLPDVVADDKPKAAEPTTQDAASEWPDPLDVARSHGTNSDQDSTPTDLAGEDKAPLTSPFLSDAKVEKRPLGGAVTPAEQPSEPVAEAALPEQDHNVADGASPQDQTVANPIDFDAPLPEELQGNLVAIESGEAEVTAASTLEAPASANVPAAVEKQPEHPAKALIPDHFTNEDMPKGPASIAQQYKEEPKTGDQTNGAIYDTEAYHKPLAHPAKKSSGWLWIVWIILILAVGAGIGAALYYLGIVK